MSDLPPGFVLDAPLQGQPQGLPPGFVLDAGGPSAGGVQDWEPTQPGPRGVVDTVNRGVNWLGTRATKAATGIAGLPRAYADLERMAVEATGLPYAPSPVAAATQFLPSSQQMNDVVFNSFGVPEANSTSRGGKVLDAATEAALGAVVMPGSLARNLIPSAVGGASQEIAGQATEGTKYEPAARLVAGVVGGAGAAGVQNALGNAGQAVKNLRPNVDKTAAKIVGRAMERDQVTGNALRQAHADLGPGAMLVEAGGPNVRGTMRGSIAAPGAARTEAQNAFDLRMEGSNARTTSALDRSISPNNSLAATVDDLSALRAQQATPAYEAAGIPRKIEKTESVRPGAPVEKMVPILPGAKMKMKVSEPGPDVVELTFNSPNIKTPELDFYLQKSPDVQAAIGAARRLPQFQELPENSMVMLDKAYKHLTGMEQEAIKAGNGTRAFDLKNLRQGFQKALTDANPKYQEALDAFAGPSKLIDSAERAKEWFSKNVDPVVVGREFEAMKSAGLEDAARIGVRDWARTVTGRSDRGVAAERVWNGGDNRLRLQTILSPDEYTQFAKSMGGERNLAKTSRDINVGSRTAPMGLEASDNAMQSGVWQDLLQGRVLSAGGKFAGNAMERVATGRTEAVNARIAKMLTSTDPNEVGLVNALLERGRLEEIARSRGRVNAFTYGGVTAPTANALAGERR